MRERAEELGGRLDIESQLVPLHEYVASLVPQIERAVDLAVASVPPPLKLVKG